MRFERWATVQIIKQLLILDLRQLLAEVNKAAFKVIFLNDIYIYIYIWLGLMGVLGNIFIFLKKNSKIFKNCHYFFQFLKKNFLKVKINVCPQGTY